MTIKSILVPMSGDGLDRPCLDAAWSVAQLEMAHVTALFGESAIETMPLMYGGDGAGFYFTEEFQKALSDRNDARRRAAQDAFETWARDYDIVTDEAPGAAIAAFLSIPGDDPDLVRRHAILSDLVVTLLPGQSSPERGYGFEAALFSAGRPVLAVARDAPPPVLDGIAVIGWNGSPEAARAISAALPLLARARTVIVVQAGGGEPAPILQFLRRRGVTATATGLAAVSGEIGPALLAEAEHLGAGLVVLGAYGHSRARELIFGGVTRHLLRHATVPLLLAH